MPSVRTIGQRKQMEIVSPYDNPFVATIAQATNRQDVERMNRNSKMRWVTNANTPDELITERDIQMGDFQISTIELCLVSWDIQDENGRVFPINEDTLKDLITPQERRWLFEKINAFNPIWNNGVEEEKNDSEPELALNSTSSSAEGS